MAEMVAVADRLVATADAAGLDDRTVFVGAFLRLVAHLTLGQVGAATEDEALCLALADRLRTPSLVVVFDAYLAMRATLDGDFEGAEHWIAHGMELHRRTQVWPADDARLGLIVPLAVERGGAEQLADGLLAAADAAGPAGRAALTFAMIVLAEAGDGARLRVELSNRGPLPERGVDWSWLAMTCAFAGIAALVGDEAAARAHAEELARPGAQRSAGTSHQRSCTFRVAWFFGHLAPVERAEALQRTVTAWVAPTFAAIHWRTQAAAWAAAAVAALVVRGHGEPLIALFTSGAGVEQRPRRGRPR